MELIIFILLNYGISNIIVHGSIFNSFREFWKSVSPNFFGVLFSCMICTPFWTGTLLSTLFQKLGFFNFSPVGSILGGEYMYVSIFLDACLSSGTTFLIHILEEYLEFNTKRD